MTLPPVAVASIYCLLRLHPPLTQNMKLGGEPATGSTPLCSLSPQFACFRQLSCSEPRGQNPALRRPRMKLPRALSCTAASCGTGPRILGMLAMTARWAVIGGEQVTWPQYSPLIGRVAARWSQQEDGCGCQHTTFGCCQDQYTRATGGDTWTLLHLGDHD